MAGAQGWALCGRSHQKLSWRRLGSRGCRAGLPGMELRLYLVLSRVTGGGQRRIWHDLSTSDIASWPVEGREGSPAMLGSGKGGRGFSGVSVSWMERS